MTNGIRLTRKQIDELEEGLNGLLGWAVTYSHLNSMERVVSLGFRAVRDLRASMRQPEMSDPLSQEPQIG